MRELTRTLKKISGKGFIGHFTSNHDITRINVNRTQREIELVFAFVLTVPGVPFIYYGDEIGMRHMPELSDKEGGYPRTGARTPMQWAAGKNMGFSEGKPKTLYLPVDGKKNAPNVEKQERNPRSLLNAVRKLTALHNDFPAFHGDGDFKVVLAKENEYPLAYIRSKGECKMLVVINPSGKSTKSIVKIAGLKNYPKKILGKGVTIGQKDKEFEIVTEGLSYAIFGL